jgi:hypothetical protein|tara:strand:+ start:1522 stop:1800 length:279 start_codon:yes stop_codon:yes gene_type:complete
MAKEKTVELKPKLEKISEEHLKELQTIINNINQAQFSVGKIESQKHKMLHELAVAEDKVVLFQEKLDKEYGTHDVNIADGKINWPKENSDEK